MGSGKRQFSPSSFRLGPLLLPVLALLTALVLSGCTGQQVVDAILAPPEATPAAGNAALPNTPLPTPTAVPIVARSLSVNVARFSVKPGDTQEIDVAGTPNQYINVIVLLANGDRDLDATHIGAQLDLNGSYVDRWTLNQFAPGGPVSVTVQDVKTGQIDHESFQVDAPSWGGPAPVGNPPIVAYVPYGTPNAGLVQVTPQASATPNALATAFPFALPTPLGGTLAGTPQVQAYPSDADIAPGASVRINGVLTDGNGKGVAGARLFAIAHFPSGHSEVWVSPAESGGNGLVWVSAPITGVPAGSTILVDVYMTYNGQSYHGQTQFRVG